jgi:hypothetical protein
MRRPSTAVNTWIVSLFLFGCYNPFDVSFGFIPRLSTRATRSRQITPITTILLQESRTDDDESLSTAQPQPPAQCPFSKPFPRYKIDMTRTPKSKDFSWSRIASPFKGLSQALQKSKLQNKLWPGETVIWEPSSFKIASPFKGLSQALQKSKLQKKLRPGETLIWEPELDGISAFSLLWDQAAKLLVSSKDNGSSSDDYSQASTTIIIALPDASRTLVQNWVEIIDWMGTLDETIGPVLLTAELIDAGSEDSTPAVRIQRIAGALLTPSSSITANSNNDVDLMIERTRAWVKRILVEQGICPFTKSVNKSGQGLADVGVPVGMIAYHGSYANHPITLFSDTWKAILAMIEAGPGGKEGVSSILLAAPAFDDDFDVWSGPIFAMLEAGVVAAQAQAEVGVVCFHPRYATPDGTTWPGFGHMHSVPRLEKWYREHAAETQQEELVVLSADEVAAGGAWQRRTPHATINVLRAGQLEAAESQRSSGELYAVNIEKLVGTAGIGSNKLARDLEQERQIGKTKQ